MDKRVFRMAILTIISAILLVLVIVYVANTEKINELLGWGQATVEESTSEVAASYYSGDLSEYGLQIGNDLDGFLADPDFFDETEKTSSTVVIKKIESTEESSDEASYSSTDEENGTGMAVVGELINPNGQGVDPATLDSSLFDYNGEMPQTPPPAGQAPGTPVGTAP
ncbi:hypothetical protein SAMN04487928_11841 [Butyrivibrio proteoclasticus]|uniref:Uncharacterized protein n=1 Tax=Butyrivibrio proteoclasticus TaxID=43305 RepID=A0A1I5VPP8_9FIRM|nr:hypothetical protein [Butyrivibrio proteoclasticus]SFQ09247.1 hypothetical protein SAMN04487928_11841 [Butyrivibrio proteoclasticus]